MKHLANIQRALQKDVESIERMQKEHWHITKTDPFCTACINEEQERLEDELKEI